MAKLLHTADWHIGQNVHGFLHPEMGVNTRLLEIAHSLDWLRSVAAEHNAPVVNAGDLTHRRTMTGPEAAVLHAALEHRRGTDILGNHDAEVHPGRDSILSTLWGVHARPTIDYVEDVPVICLPYPNRAVIASAGITHLEAADMMGHLVSDLLGQVGGEAIVLGHFSISGASYNDHSQPILMTGTDFVVEPGTLAQDGVKAIMLGHIHKHQEHEANGVPLVYSGSPQRLTFGDQDNVSGVVIWDTDDWSYEFIRNPHDPVFVTLDSWEPGDTIGGVEGAYVRYKGAPLSAAAKGDLRAAIDKANATLCGVTEIREHKVREASVKVAKATNDVQVIGAYATVNDLPDEDMAAITDVMVKVDGGDE